MENKNHITDYELIGQILDGNANGRIRYKVLSCIIDFRFAECFTTALKATKLFEYETV